MNTANGSKDLHKKWQNHFPLDSGTTFSMLVNEELADEIVDADKPTNVITNAGERVINEQAKLSGLGNLCPNEDGLANLFGVNDLII